MIFCEGENDRIFLDEIFKKYIQIPPNRIKIRMILLNSRGGHI